jgi:hypothetical protein
VKVAEFPGSMKGQIEIVIGTTNESQGTRMTEGANRLQVVQDDLLPVRNRSASISSVVTTATLPPSYNQLPSQAENMLSLETRKFRSSVKS